MKIIQITDLHIAKEGENTFGVDVRQNFLHALQEIRSHAPDLLVLTGDLCYDTGDEKIYRWIKSHLDFLNIPYTVIGGNHDNSATLAGVFRLKHLLVGPELFYRRDLDGRPVLFLETSSGVMSETQLEWLANELGHIREDIVVFMHHPPLKGGVPYMDRKYALKNMDEVQSLFFTFPHRVRVFCGHYHAEKTLCARNLTVHITPSTYFQIDWRSEDFRVDHYRTALREIILRKDGIVESTVMYHKGQLLQQ